MRHVMFAAIVSFSLAAAGCDKKISAPPVDDCKEAVARGMFSSSPEQYKKDMAAAREKCPQPPSGYNN